MSAGIAPQRRGDAEELPVHPLDQVRALAEGRATPELFAAMRAEARGRLLAARKRQPESRPLAKIIPFDAAAALMEDKERAECISASRRFGQARAAAGIPAALKSVHAPMSQRVLQVLRTAEGPMTATEIGDALRRDRNTVNHYVRALQADGKIARQGVGTKTQQYTYTIVEGA